VIGAIPELLLVHKPSGGVLVYPAKLPEHIVPGPTIGDGIALTVITLVDKQPVYAVLVIVTAPAETPVTTPPGLMVAVAVEPLLHEPPMVVSVSVMVWPTHTLLGPSIGDTGSTTTGENT
jgi:hypothetical protein